MCTRETISTLKSPFKHHADIYKELKEDFKRIRAPDGSPKENYAQDKVSELVSWMCETPNSITYRVNTNVTNCQEISKLVTQQFRVPPDIRTFNIPEIIMIDCWKSSVELDLETCQNEVTVDPFCGAAVLRGAHVFAPGVMSMPHGLQVGNKVSVFADKSGCCRKGSKNYDAADRVFLGNGLVEKNRRHLFDEAASPSGIAVRITATRSRLPQLGDASVNEGHALLQNLPSIICSRILDPRPGERILDMCAAPGNKTTHLSALMKNEGTLIALEKIQSKIQRLRKNSQIFGCKNLIIHCFDATKAFSENENQGERYGNSDEPPFSKGSFDRVLLDGPCSALGQRPQIANKITLKELRSYVPLQRKLFSTAVKLLKIDGILVYSTCTVTISENEGIVAWALKKFPELKLSPIRAILNSMGLDREYCGTSGYSIDGLNEEESKNLLRFGPESRTVGFFIARFVKICDMDQ